mgnify:CR=1 FL=1
MKTALVEQQRQIERLQEELARKLERSESGKVKKTAVPFLDLTKVVPNFNMKQQAEQLKQYKQIQQNLKDDTESINSN